MNIKEQYAFPIKADYFEFGMTLRDYFASKVLATFLTAENSDLTPSEAAEFAYVYADAMLEERKITK